MGNFFITDSLIGQQYLCLDVCVIILNFLSTFSSAQRHRENSCANHLLCEYILYSVVLLVQMGSKACNIAMDNTEQSPANLLISVGLKDTA